MSNAIKFFKDIIPDDLASVGGKGGALAKMYQAGYPIPDGFIIFPQAFAGDVPDNSSKEEVKYRLNVTRKKHPDVRFAVRSSATAEDSARASFAGQFETVLDAKTDEDVLDAILKVRQSGKSKRVQAYSSIKKTEKTHGVAVVVQIMIPSEISGVLFTADPVTGNFAFMVGNYVWGMGEQLVSGAVNAERFTLTRLKGLYAGSDKFKKYASSLYKLAVKIERDFGTPQDIEWAVADGMLYILQARPITTLSPGDYNTYEINDSLAGDFLWTNTNVGEALTDVFTPLSWSMLRKLDKEQERLPGHYLFSGNICGRIYSNTGLLLSLMPTFGIGVKWMSKLVEEMFGGMPSGMTVPVYPFQKLSLLKFIISCAPRNIIWLWKTRIALSAYLRNTLDWCSQITQRITKTKTAGELLELWRNDLWPYNIQAMQMALSVTNVLVLASKLRKELIALMGQTDTSTLLSNFRGDVGLESLGPVTGLSKVIKGEMNREEYLARYGHRGPHEFELLVADSREDSRQLDRELDGIKAAGVDTETLLEKQRLQYEETKKKLAEHFPKQVKSIEKRLMNIAKSARRRELARSEWTRVFRVNRTFALKVGLLSGIGDDVFFLYIDEVLALLSGNRSVLQYISTRKNNYKRFKDLPSFPPFIRGRFDPFIWAKDSNRRNDYYDPTAPVAVIDNSIVLKGFAGATGRIKGSVRVLLNPEEGEKLKLGEILVTATTNIGWTPLFLKASAIITDVGAPLSHAAIVARELGIPAVVGCGDATARLRTGDCVIVDGGQGVVEILKDKDLIKFAGYTEVVK